MAPVKGNTVVVCGCGPVGQFVIASAELLRAGCVLAVDCIESRLELTRAQGAEVINFEQEEPVQTILDLTGGIGVDRAIDAVDVDAVRPRKGPAARQARDDEEEFDRELQKIAPEDRAEAESQRA